MIHLYCVAERSASRPEHLAGIGGCSARPVEQGNLVAWVTDCPADSTTVDALKEHERLVREVLRHSTPIPFRFADGVQSEADVRALLDDRAADFAEMLERLRGSVEMTLRVRQPGRREAEQRAQPIDVGQGGRAYLERRRALLEAQRSEQDELMDQLRSVDEPLAELVQDSRLNPRSRGERLGTVAHLVHADHVRSYLERVRMLQQRRPELQLVASGPWAPYSFV